MKLGELFVDLGVNSGGAFNTLSTFAFQFENLATLSERVSDWVGGFFGDTPKYATRMNQLSKATGMAVEDLQDLEFAANRYGATLDSVVGKMGSLLAEYTQWTLQGKKLDDGFAKKFLQIGMTPSDLAGITSVRQLIQKIIEITKTNPEKAPFIKQTILSQDMIDTFDLYYNRREELGDLEEALSYEQVDNLSRIDRTLKMVQENASRRYKAWKADHVETFEALLKWTDSFNKELFEAINNTDGFGNTVSSVIDLIIDKFEGLSSVAEEYLGGTGIIYSIFSGIAEGIRLLKDAVKDGIEFISILGRAIFGEGKGNLGDELMKYYENSAFRKRFNKAMETWFPSNNPTPSNAEYNWKEDYENMLKNKEQFGYTKEDVDRLFGVSSLQPMTYSPVYNTTINTDRDNVEYAYNSVMRGSRDNSSIMDSMLTRRFSHA